MRNEELFEARIALSQARYAYTDAATALEEAVSELAFRAQEMAHLEARVNILVTATDEGRHGSS